MTAVYVCIALFALIFLIVAVSGRRPSKIADKHREADKKKKRRTIFDPYDNE